MEVRSSEEAGTTLQVRRPRGSPQWRGRILRAVWWEGRKPLLVIYILRFVTVTLFLLLLGSHWHPEPGWDYKYKSLQVLPGAQPQ